jgi:hypothetical protein
VTGEFWIAVTEGKPGSSTFPDGTQVRYETNVSKDLKAKIEADGSPFDAFR